MTHQPKEKPGQLKLKKISIPVFRLQGGICISPTGTGPTFPGNPKPPTLAIEPICI